MKIKIILFIFTYLCHSLTLSALNYENDFFSVNKYSQDEYILNKKNTLTNSKINPAGFDITDKDIIELIVITPKNKLYIYNQNELNYFIGYGKALNKNISLGLNYYLNRNISYTYNTNVNYMPMNRNEEIRTITTNHSVHIQEKKLAIPISIKINKKIKLGININYSMLERIRNDELDRSFTDKYNTNKLALDIGMLFKPTDKLSIGLSYTPESEFSINSSSKIEKEPQETKFNITVVPLENAILYTGYYLKSYSKISNLNDSHKVNIGLEYLFFNKTSANITYLNETNYLISRNYLGLKDNNNELLMLSLKTPLSKRLSIRGTYFDSINTKSDNQYSIGIEYKI